MKNEITMQVGYHEVAAVKANLDLKAEELKFKELCWICEHARQYSKNIATAEILQVRAFNKIVEMAKIEWMAKIE